MRYDQTVPVCRVVGQYKNELTMPFRRYQIQPAYRAEKPQKGRYREFLQCDADIFGVKGAMADAEVIALSLDIYRKLGFGKAKVLINDRELLKDIPYEAVSSIDKLSKIGEEGVVEDMKKKGIEENKAWEYLNIVKNLEPNERINTILNYLEKCGFSEDWYEFNPTVVRSFSYSSGPIWEIIIPDWRERSVLGGERYDGMVKKITGEDVGGTGFGLGFDRTLEAMEELGLLPEFKTVSLIMVTGFGEEYLDRVLEIARALREKGIGVEVYPDLSVKMGKQFKYASRKNIKFVMVIGENEIKENKVALKNMESGEQVGVSLEEGINKISNSE